MSKKKDQPTGKSNAQRKREHDERQRSMGRRQRNYWLTDAEAEAVAKFIANQRCSPAEN